MRSVRLWVFRWSRRARCSATATVLEGNPDVYWEGRSELVARRSVLTGAALALVIALTGCKPDGVELVRLM